MTSNTSTETDRAAQRAAIERVIAHYPDIAEDELHDVLHYFRVEASALDRAIIASNEEIGGQYRRLLRDYSLDRLSAVETGVTVLFVLLLVVAILFFALGDWTL